MRAGPIGPAQSLLPPKFGDFYLSLSRLRAAFERLLEFIVLVLMVALTALIVAGAVFRYIGNALSWYDELASIGLVWLTYYGAALAALRGAHIGVPGLVNAMPPKARLIATLFAESMVFLFFGVLAIYGAQVLIILQGEHLVSMPEVPTQLDSVGDPRRRRAVHDRRGPAASRNIARRAHQGLCRTGDQGGARAWRA